MAVYGGPSSGRLWRNNSWSFMEEQVLVVDQVMVADS